MHTAPVGKRRPPTGRRMLAGLALAAVVAGCAHTSSPGGGSAAPRVNEDHWHAAFGVYVCDRYLPALPTFESPIGTHTHGDGVIHIHPFSAAGAGGNARLGAFLDGAGVELAGDQVTVAGTTYRRGRDCGGRPATIEVVKWRHAAGDGKPQVVTHDGRRLRFQGTGEAYAIAVVPAGTDVPKPPATAQLAALGGTDSAAGASTTVARGGTAAAPPVSTGFHPVLDTGPGGSFVTVQLTPAGLASLNLLAADCYGKVPSCATGRVALVVDGAVVTAPAMTSARFDQPELQIRVARRADAETIAAALGG